MVRQMPWPSMVSAVSLAFPWSQMPKPPPQRGPVHDPMVGVVDRLLAQLPGLQTHSEPPKPNGARAPGYSVAATAATAASRESTKREGDVSGMWLRVVLGLSLAVMMGWWPYARTCGLPLFGYMAAVSTVMFAGAWAGSASWRVRNGLAHTIALVLLLYGMLLGASELLPRTGYAVERATWTCQEAGSSPSIVLSVHR
jgi:hypothetical protein